MEARKNPKTDAQRDQYLAVCRHTHDNIIFNYGSVENYIVAKNTEINTAESKLQSYYDNPRKGKSRRPAIIAGLENTIFIMKNSLTNALRDLEELDAAQAAEAPQISTETAETVNVSADGENAAETKEMPQILNCEPHTIADLKEIPNISKLAKAGIIINGVSWHTEYLDQTHNVLARVDNLGWHEDGKGFGDFQGSGVFGKTAIFESWDNAVITMIDALTDYLRTRSTEPPHSPKTPQTAECVGDSPETREATYADIENASKELAEQSKAMGTTSVMELPRGIGNPRQVCTYGIRCGLLLL